jgi:hypothetical protein
VIANTASLNASTRALDIVLRWPGSVAPSIVALGVYQIRVPGADVQAASRDVAGRMVKSVLLATMLH